GWCGRTADPSGATVAGVTGPITLPLPRRALAAAWQRGIGPGPSGVDLVHAPTMFVPPARRGVPLVVTVHDAVPWTHPATLTPHGVRWHQAMGQRVARQAAAVIVPTRAVAAEIGPRLGIGDDRLHVIGEGVSAAVTTLPPDAAQRAVRLRLPADGYLLSLATLEPRKGLDVALAALADPASPGLPLLLVGAQGWGGLDPAAEAARRGLPPSAVRVLGRLPDADLAVVLAGATALLMPSRAEGFGLPVLEAMACGVPAIISDAPALVEVGGEAVVTVPVGDAPALAAAIAAVAGDGKLRETLRMTGLARAKKFTWNAVAHECWALYRRLTGVPASSERWGRRA
ncbi:MAG: glycosyltransferase family 4 protein, partial [Frankia sp.]